ncbi:hypothetical protein [Fervidobacterium gondwanense]|uniref:hypothetical protein n=1 Tax=Fervidobacterium gondwanense TaxID=44754 RepID=UPI003C736D20
MEELKVIAHTCVSDERIYEIVSSVAQMSDDELSQFRTKVISYFMTKNSPEDKEAYRFYRILLEDQNAKKVLEFYEEIKNNSDNSI